jgi:hypothetical protein
MANKNFLKYLQSIEKTEKQNNNNQRKTGNGTPFIYLVLKCQNIK